MWHRQHLNLKWIWIVGRMTLCEKRMKMAGRKLILKFSPQADFNFVQPSLVQSCTKPSACSKHNVSIVQTVMFIYSSLPGSVWFKPHWLLFGNMFLNSLAPWRWGIHFEIVMSMEISYGSVPNHFLWNCSQANVPDHLWLNQHWFR